MSQIQVKLTRLVERNMDLTSVITSKPAIRDHFKTGQRNYSGQEEFYRIFD